MKRLIFTLVYFVCFGVIDASESEVCYDIDIEYQTVCFANKPVQAMTVGGGIPGPLIEGKEGDKLRVTFHNFMDVETSIHWHGIILPNDQDGVPYLNTPPIPAKGCLTFEYPLVQSGTYWYHSHTGLQEQRGVYGPIVIHPQKEDVQVDGDHVLVFSDWIDTPPDKVLSNLKRDGDYYALKKGTVQPWCEVLSQGYPGIKNRIRGSLSRMGSMDISDVGYDAFLTNGESCFEIGEATKGETFRLRLINASASTYFSVEFAGGEMTIVSADGLEVDPVKVSKLQIAVAETYDVLVTLPENNSYELRASSTDGTGYTSAFIGTGNPVCAPLLPKPNLILMSMHSRGDATSMGSASEMHQNHHMSGMGGGYSHLMSPKSTKLPSGNPWKEVCLRLTGFMDGYVWSFDDKTLSEADNILIQKGENVRFVLKNETMMNHPIHLHGHFFRVVNGQGDYSPLKHTVNVPPLGTVEIEFEADQEGDWFFHCHNLYHMAAGMARVVSYQGTSNYNQCILNHLEHDRDWYKFLDFSLQTNMVTTWVQLSNSRNSFELDFDCNYGREYELEAIYERRVTQFLTFYTGAKFENKESRENVAVFGIHYVLPLLLELDLRINSEGQPRLGLASDLQLTNQLNFSWYWNTDQEYRLVLMYELSKSFDIQVNYDSDYQAGLGVGVKL